MKSLLVALAAVAVVWAGMAEAMAQSRTCNTTCERTSTGGKSCTKTCW